METLVQQFIKAFGWSIVNSLWQSALIYGVLFIVLLSLPKLAAKYKHNLAFGSIVLMFGCFAYNFISHLLKNVPGKTNVTNIATLEAYQYFNNVPQSLSSKIEQYFPLVVAFYLIGIALQLFVIGKGYNQLSKLKKNNLSSIPDSWKLIFESVTANLKINKTIKFHLSEIVNVPLVIGYLKPVVLFPLALVNQLDNEQVEAILIHELSHIRRNDFLLNLIKTAIETFLFYNPFVWMAGRFVHIEREHACDDLVLKVTGKPLNYAHALLKLELIKDKTSPAYALAATGKTQNLYQRIKRITNMKTNYLNAKQQMAALTLGVACIFSIAWINPAERKKEEKKTLNQHILQLKAIADQKPVIFLDTTKKRKIKIVTIDASGKKTEYNSLKELPDSLRKDFYRDELFGDRNAFVYQYDSAFKFRDTAFRSKIFRDFSSPEARAKWKKFGEDVAKEYNSPENRAKWKKMSEDMAKEYNSPKAQAKWKKMSEDLAKEYNSPEAQAKWKKFGEDIAKEYGSPEAQAKYKKIADDVLASIRTEDFKIKLDSNARLSMTEYMGMALKELSAPEWRTELDELRKQRNTKDYSKSQRELSSNFQKKFREKYGEPNTRNSESVRILIDRNDKVKNSEEYQKLKQKFDKEVKELREKMEKKEQKEKAERPENPEQ
ncbi:M56 family metallopeptidase [Pedobacter aquatilis]|uniref:M56 family metallopeptidase n=1 Tax=Pedobacter aquatilis TaxID=351343 RepID=UPI00292E0696|nr:M56 family metallopeptidase [Pedobacter aquatilis]